MSDKKDSWLGQALPVVLSALIGISVSCSVGYFGFQRAAEARIAVLENQIKNQESELTRQRDLVASTIEPRLRGIETQLAAIRVLLEQKR